MLTKDDRAHIYEELRLRSAALPGARLYRQVANENPITRTDWDGIDPRRRERLAKRLFRLMVTGIVAANILVGIETVALVLLATTGGDLRVSGETGKNVIGVVVGLVVVAIVDVVAGIAVVRPHMQWFIDGHSATEERRRAVQRMPIAGSAATAIAWVLGVGVYIACSGGVGMQRFAIVAGAFALAAVSSGAATYMVLERSARPLAAAAMRDQPHGRPVIGIRERMAVLWIVCCAVPLVGILMMNVGRVIGWIPMSRTAIDIPTVVLAVICLASGARAIAAVSTSITAPLASLRQSMDSVRHGQLEEQVQVYDSSEIGVLQEGFNGMVDGLAERERLQDLFARHVGSEVADLAMRSDAGMHGAKADVGVLFVDIEGSTRYAESHDPTDVAKMLNRFFTIVANAVERHGGFINKFEGDAALAVFGAPSDTADPVAAALTAARELGSELNDIAPLRAGVGVSGGRVFAGNIGALTRYEYTVIGDPVNECARLADVAKRSRSNVLASGSAMSALLSGDIEDAQTSAHDEFWEWMALGAVELRGRSAQTELFAPTELVESDDFSFTDLVDGLIRIPMQVLRGKRTAR